VHHDIKAAQIPSTGVAYVVLDNGQIWVGTHVIAEPLDINDFDDVTLSKQFASEGGSDVAATTSEKDFHEAKKLGLKVKQSHAVG
jgi:hypothetical protein